MLIDISDDEMEAPQVPVPDPVSEGPFSGCSIALAPFGDLRGTLRRSVIAAKICDAGGVVSYKNPATSLVCSHGSQDGLHSTPTHVVVARIVAQQCCDSSLSAIQLAKRLAAFARDARYVVSEDWYSKSLLTWSRQPEEAYMVKSAGIISHRNGPITAMPRHFSRSRSPDREGQKESIAPSPERKLVDIRPPLPEEPVQSHKYRHRPSKRSKTRIGGVPPVQAVATSSRMWAQNARGRFACQRGVGGPPKPLPGRNAALVTIFEEMAEAVTTASCAKSDEFRARQYRKACQAIRNLSVAVEPCADLSSLRRQLGPRTFAKVEEWMETGDVAKASTLRLDPRVRELTDLRTIWGVGPTTAVSWRSMGLRSIDDVRRRSAGEPQFLTQVQSVGVKHFEDFQVKIPREEVTEIFERVACEARIVFGEATLEVQCCGSYRRGRQLCGDVDVLICSHRTGAENRSILYALVARLAEQGFISDWTPSTNRSVNVEYDCAGGGSATFCGVCRLQPDLPFRRLDIKVWPTEEHAFALLHFTGSGHFNRSMRLFARRMGYTLSDHGLCECRRMHGERIWSGPGVHCTNEREIFAALGLDYVPPTNRDVVPSSLNGPAGAADSMSNRCVGEESPPEMPAVIEIEDV